jgi:hypothetical protein
MARGEGLDDLARIVAAVVVHDDDLEAGCGTDPLGSDACQRLAQLACVVVGADDEAEVDHARS